MTSSRSDRGKAGGPHFRPARSSVLDAPIATDFFGRRKGKPLSQTQQRLIEDLFPRISLNPLVPISDIRSFFARDADALWSKEVWPKEVWMEIGFGGGEHLIRQALANREVAMIGVEPFVNGLVKALGRIEAEGIETIRLYDEDAAHILDWLPSASLDRLFLLYPDPWHKKRHWKRRFVSDANLKRMVRVLKPGGIFRFASDVEDYVEWTLEHVAAVPDLVDATDNREERLAPWPDWQRTRYEEKAFREGRKPHYLTFRRV